MSVFSCFLRRVAYLLIFSSYFLACAPKQIVISTSNYLPLAVTESFIVIPEDDPVDLSNEEVIGEIKLKDNGLSLICNYETIVALATKEARQMGANCIQIYEHRVPDMVSTCHRIKARAIRLKNVRPFEKEIVWHPGRRLELMDFKGKTENRPFQAATVGAIRYNYLAAPLASKFTFQVETIFDCRTSYFKEGINTEQTLAHEQGHFDMTELYARKYLKAIQEQVYDLKELEKNHAKIYQGILESLYLEQDKYDTEIYADRSKQKAWLLTIREALTSLDAYSDKKIQIPVNNKGKG